MKMMAFIATSGSPRKLTGPAPKVESKALMRPVLAFELYRTVHKTAITTIDVTWGAKYIVRKIDTPRRRDLTSSARHRANTHWIGTTSTVK